MTVAVLEQKPLAGEMTNQSVSFESFVLSQPETHGVYAGGPLEDGVYISPAAVSPDTSVEELPLVRDVEFLPGVQLGAGDSQNGVTFAQLDFATGNRPGRTRVAVKPFSPDEQEPDKAQRAVHEHDRLREAAALGFDTLKPLALARDGDTSYLITELRDDIETLDNVDWTIPPSDERYATELLPHLTFIAEHMGETHGKGLFNGDPQTKNFAKADTGQPIVIDLESAIVATDPAQHAALLSGGYEVRDSMAYKDVRQFWFTLTRGIGTESSNIFLQEEDYDTCMRVFGNDFLDPYVQSLRKHLSAEVAIQVDIDSLRESIYQNTARMG